MDFENNLKMMLDFLLSKSKENIFVEKINSE